MYIKEIKLNNFRGFENLILEKIPQNLLVLIGVNGSGKTSILFAITLLLSYFIAWCSDQDNIINDTQQLQDQDVKNDCKLTTLEITTNFGYWKIEKEYYQKQQILREDKAKNYVWTRQRKWQENPNFNIPLLVYYPVNRKVDHILLELPEKDYFKQIDAYNQALTGVEINFNSFFQWFRQKEDIENEIRLNEDNNYRDKQLETVRKAITQLMPNIGNLRVRRTPAPLRLILTKNNEYLVINQLSDGEKCLLAMIGDLAQRLVIANPSLDNSLEGKGIVLIDEIELHLHPQWQREIIPKLQTIFPHCQFIITTHSPQVLSNINRENIFILEDFKIIKNTPHSYGRDSNSILYDLMNVTKRPEHTQKIIDQMFDLMEKEDENSINKAKELLTELEKKLGEQDTEIIRAKSHLEFMEELNEID